jgi:hypothetical protein
LEASEPNLTSYIWTASCCTRNHSAIEKEENQRVATSWTGFFTGSCSDAWMPAKSWMPAVERWK